MGFFRPYTVRQLHEQLTKTIERWDSLPEKLKKKNEFINPDEPIVISAPGQSDSDELDDEEETDCYYHIMSYGGGGNKQDGEDIGHDGGHIDCMEIDQNEFLYHGRRLKK